MQLAEVDESLRTLWEEWDDASTVTDGSSAAEQRRLKTRNSNWSHFSIAAAIFATWSAM